MANYKNIKIKMKDGKSRIQRVKVLASGKYKFVKNLTKSKSAPNPKKKASKGGKGGKKVAKKKRRRSNSMTIPLAVAFPVAAPLLSGIGYFTEGDFEGAARHYKETFTGVDDEGQIHWDWLMKTYGPMILGACIHKFVGGKPLNINAMLGRAKVPFIRI